MNRAGRNPFPFAAEYEYSQSVVTDGETLEGVIYLPNRNVTYNSTTNVSEKLSMVVNQMIVNSANWQVEPYTGTNSSASNAGARLTE